MSDGPFPDRLSQLRARWEADPSSRIFLQLAEEYRHQGRVKEALSVLEKGLKEHPGYLSALVAKGRCLLELGEALEARGVLERVVQQDATQMVANKLLVRAYVETGEAGRARERLDLYSLLNDSDPEIEELRRRVKALERPAPRPVPAPEPVPDIFEEAGPVAAPPPAAVDDPFGDLAAAPPIREARADVFDLDPPVPAPPRSAAPVFLEPEPAVFPEPAAATALTALAAAPPGESRQEEVFPEDDGDLFPGLATRTSRQRYLAGLAAEGIFDEPVSVEAGVISAALTTAAAMAPSIVIAPPPEPVPPAESVGVEEPIEAFEMPETAGAAGIVEVTEEPAFEPAPFTFGPEPFPLSAEAAPVPVWAEPLPELQPFAGELSRQEPAVPALEPFDEPEPFDDLSVLPSLEPGEAAFPEAREEPRSFASEPLPTPEEAAEPPVPVSTASATATLGELYLRQGHSREAERIFREVLEREPENSAAIAGLEQARHAAPVHGPVDADQLLEGFDGRENGGPKARKIALLTRYLKRIRSGSQPHVS